MPKYKVFFIIKYNFTVVPKHAHIEFTDWSKVVATYSVLKIKKEK